VRRFVIDFSDKGSFFEEYLTDLPTGGVFARTDETYAIGEPVVVELGFPDLRERLTYRGRVAWRRRPAKWRSALSPGIGIAFAAEEAERVDFLLSMCRGRATPKRRPGHRVESDFRVEFSTGEGWSTGRVRDISAAGVFVTSGAPPPELTPIDLRLYVEKACPPKTLSGRVVWQRTEGDDAGFGVQFALESALRRRRANEIAETARRSRAD
jgi:uncharacterized protein (TIGR02266 family)